MRLRHHLPIRMEAVTGRGVALHHESCLLRCLSRGWLLNPRLIGWPCAKRHVSWYILVAWAVRRGVVWVGLCLCPVARSWRRENGLKGRLYEPVVNDDGARLSCPLYSMDKVKSYGAVTKDH